jgi:predicted nuclease of predicted toxin-antitoxin system
VHVRDVGLKGHVDNGLWQDARGSAWVIVSIDTDFHELSYVEGFPPKVSWLDTGNAAIRSPVVFRGY